MHSGVTFKIKEVLIWTRRDLYKFFIIASIPVVLYHFLDWTFLSMPWLPITMVGTAVAFLVAFKNNASYDRTWEARKIYGAIVNSSRSWGVMSIDYVNNLHATKEQKRSDEILNEKRSGLIHRHIAWLTALRFQLRKDKPWESTVSNRSNTEYRDFFTIEERSKDMDEELAKILSSDDMDFLRGKANKATQILKLQSKALNDLRHEGLIDDFRHIEMENMIADFYTQQGKAERIKNFPYPRQYATINKYFIWLFVFLVPFGLLKEFDELGNNFIWLTIPFSVIVSWVFHTMERIGEASENPFEGGANDIPITALSRTIEIDLREMLEEDDIPKPIQASHNILF